MANHGAGKFAPRKMTLSSILYIIILEINNIYTLQGEIRARERIREGDAGFESQPKKMKSERKIFDLWLCQSNIND